MNDIKKESAVSLIQKAPIQSHKGTKNDNVPTKKFEAALRGVEEKKDGLQKSWEDLAKRLDDQDLDQGDRKQLIREVKSLLKQIKKLSDQIHDIQDQLSSAGVMHSDCTGRNQGSDDHVDSDPESDSPTVSGATTMVVCWGYQAKATEALNELTLELQELQRLQRTMEVAVLKMESGDKDHEGALMATANSMMDAANNDGETAMLQGIGSAVSAFTDLAGAGVSAGMTWKMNSTLNAPGGLNEQMNDMETLQRNVVNAPPANAQAQHGDVIEMQPLDKNGKQVLDPAKKARMDEIAECSDGSLKRKDGDDELYRFIKADDQKRSMFMSNLHKIRNTKSSEINNLMTSVQTTQRTASIVCDIAKSSGNAAVGFKTQDQKEQQGKNQARSELSKYTTQELEAVLNAVASAAQAYDQTSVELNRGKAAVNNQAATA